MITVPLSSKMGIVVWENHDERVIEHPVLYIGSDYSGLKNEVREWLDQNCRGGWHFDFNQHTYELKFYSQDDAMLFQLRWT